MVEGKVLTMFRDDLVDHSKEKKIEDISIVDFKGEGIMRRFADADFLIFVDVNWKNKILKNRRGPDDIIF